MKAKGVQTALVEGFAITNQRETTLLWDKETGEPLHPALLWNDGRTAGIVKELIETTPTKKLDELRVSTNQIRKSLLSQLYNRKFSYGGIIISFMHSAYENKI